MTPTRAQVPAPQDRTVGRTSGHPWGELVATSGEIQWPPTGRFSWPPSGASSRGQRRFARSSPTTTPRPRPDFSDRAGTSDGPTPTRAARTEAAPCCRILGADAQAQAAACALDEQQRPIADSSFARMRDSRGSSGSQASCDVAASVDVVAVAVTSSDASPLLLVLTRSGAAVDAGGCSAAGATARCACKPQRMGPPASTSAALAIAAKQGSAQPVAPTGRAEDAGESRDWRRGGLGPLRGLGPALSMARLCRRCGRARVARCRCRA